MRTVKSPVYMTTTEVAKLLNFTPTTVARWARARKIPGAAKFGRDWRFDRKIVTAWLAAHRGIKQAML